MYIVPILNKIYLLNILKQYLIQFGILLFDYFISSFNNKPSRVENMEFILVGLVIY